MAKIWLSCCLEVSLKTGHMEVCSCCSICSTSHEVVLVQWFHEGEDWVVLKPAGAILTSILWWFVEILASLLHAEISKYPLKSAPACAHLSEYFNSQEWWNHALKSWVHCLRLIYLPAAWEYTFIKICCFMNFGEAVGHMKSLWQSIKWDIIVLHHTHDKPQHTWAYEFWHLKTLVFFAFQNRDTFDKIRHV